MSDSLEMSATSGSKPSDVELAMPSASSPSCSQSVGTFLLSHFVRHDPFVETLRPRPSAGRMGRDICCSIVLGALLLTFAIEEGIRLHGQPPVSTIERISMSPPTVESTVVFSVARWSASDASFGESYVSYHASSGGNVTGVETLWTNLQSTLLPQLEQLQGLPFMNSNDAILVTPLPISEPYGNPYSPLITLQTHTLAFFPLCSTTPLYFHHNYAGTTTQATLTSQVGAGILIWLRSYQIDSPESGGILHPWFYQPGAWTHLEVNLDVIVDHTKTGESGGPRITQVHSLTEFSTQLPVTPTTSMQLDLKMANLYTRTTITQPAWVLQWLSNIGGAFTLLVIVLSALSGPFEKILLRFYSTSSFYSWLNDRIRTVFSHQWRSTLAMEQID